MTMVEHPDIRMIQMTGYPTDYEETDGYICPVCGREAYEHVFRSDGEVIGCDQCVECVHYWEMESEK